MRDLVAIVVALVITAGAGTALVTTEPAGDARGRDSQVEERLAGVRPEEPPSISCDEELCWWTEMGRPTAVP